MHQVKYELKTQPDYAIDAFEEQWKYLEEQRARAKGEHVNSLDLANRLLGMEQGLAYKNLNFKNLREELSKTTDKKKQEKLEKDMLVLLVNAVHDKQQEIGRIAQEAKLDKPGGKYLQGTIEDLIKYNQLNFDYQGKKKFDTVGAQKYIEEQLRAGKSKEEIADSMYKNMDKYEKDSGLLYRMKGVGEFFRALRHPKRNIFDRTRRKLGLSNYSGGGKEYLNEVTELLKENKGIISDKVEDSVNKIKKAEAYKGVVELLHEGGYMKSKSDYHTLSDAIRVYGKTHKKEMKKHMLEDLAAAILFWAAGIVALVRAKGSPITGAVVISNINLDPNNILFIIGFLCLIVGTAVFLHSRHK
ncbi:MAG: hypothetical protein PHT54_01660 [Candidatus Nanoarchaeia archaeon]|nr:hypothetical protein [Candidatus Nanoarchaeia archaeon]